jgi:hypothetical protein
MFLDVETGHTDGSIRRIAGTREAYTRWRADGNPGSIHHLPGGEQTRDRVLEKQAEIGMVITL